MTFRSVDIKASQNLIIDSIESYSRKENRLEKIFGFFSFLKITKSSKISAHIKHRLQTKKDGLTKGFEAIDAPFNFAILKDNKSDYRYAYFVAFGLAGYKRELNDEAMEKLRRIFEICPPSSLDICFDSENMPDFEALALFGTVTRVKGSQTRYLNAPDLYGIDRVIIYDKALKDGFAAPLWRIEFRCPILQKLKHYEPPIDEMERVVSALCGSNALAKTATNPKIAQKGGKQ
ncbi:MAG TPA: hypothetical protein PLV58_09970 [Campylobacterales bacterium]|nr:hypothetical protein [Campylobacterales bacterium]